MRAAGPAPRRAADFGETDGHQFTSSAGQPDYSCSSSPEAVSRDQCKEKDQSAAPHIGNTWAKTAGPLTTHVADLRFRSKSLVNHPGVNRVSCAGADMPTVSCLSHAPIHPTDNGSKSQRDCVTNATIRRHNGPWWETRGNSLTSTTDLLAITYDAVDGISRLIGTANAPVASRLTNWPRLRPVDRAEECHHENILSRLRRRNATRLGP